MIHVLAAATLALAAAPVADTPYEIGPPMHVAGGSWLEFDANEELGLVAAVWHAGQDVHLRVYALEAEVDALTPLGPPRRVNEVTSGQQDEPTVLWFRCPITLEHRILVLWSDRSGTWTAYMSVQGREFYADGTPASPEQPVMDLADGWAANWNPTASVWLAFAKADPRGGAFVTGTAGWLERVVGRRWGGGGPEGPEVMLSDTGASGDACCGDLAFDRFGNLAVVWMEFTGSNTHLRARRLSSSGRLDPIVGVAIAGGDQAFANVVARRSGGWLVAWREVGAGIRSRKLGGFTSAGFGPVRDHGGGSFPKLEPTAEGFLLTRGSGSPASYRTWLHRLGPRGAERDVELVSGPSPFPPNVTESPPHARSVQGGRAVLIGGGESSLRLRWGRR